MARDTYGNFQIILAGRQTYDLANRLTSFTTPDGTSAFTYDPTGQLTGVTAGAMPAENYAYTANGNRTGTDYTTGADNQTTAAPVGDGTTDTYTYSYECAFD